MTAPPSSTARAPDKPTNVLLMTLSAPPSRSCGASPCTTAALSSTSTASSGTRTRPSITRTSCLRPVWPRRSRTTFRSLRSENKPRFVRIKTHNIVGYSDPAASTPACACADCDRAGPAAKRTADCVVQRRYPCGLGRTQRQPSRVWRRRQTAHYALHGGMGHQRNVRFPSCAQVVMTPNTRTYTIGGNNITTGVKQTTLLDGIEYFVRITAFNAKVPAPCRT